MQRSSRGTGTHRALPATHGCAATGFPNETYEDRFRTVANSNEGAQLFAQMSRAGAED